MAVAHVQVNINANRRLGVTGWWPVLYGADVLVVTDL